MLKKVKSHCGYLISLQFKDICWRALVFLSLIWLSDPSRFLDESPRWLVIRGQFDRAQKILEKAAHWNDVQLPPAGQLERLMRNIQKEVRFRSNFPRYEIWKAEFS